MKPPNGILLRHIENCLAPPTPLRQAIWENPIPPKNIFGDAIMIVNWNYLKETKAILLFLLVTVV